MMDPVVHITFKETESCMTF